MRKERFNNQKGIALILTLTIIVILAALAVELDYLVRVNISNAATIRDHTKALYIAKTGINIAFSLLKDDTNGHDSLHEDWGKFDEYSALSHLLLDEGSFSGAIGDEAGKININKLVKQDDHLDDIRKEQLKKLFTILGLSGKYEDIDTIIDDIADWIDKDNSTATFETEDEYYTSLQDPYTCKNGPLEIITELLLIRGISDDLFYGTKEHEGIGNYLTVYGDGKININTCSATVLMTLCYKDGDSVMFPIDQDLAKSIIEHRTENEFKKVSDIENVLGMEGLHTKIKDLLTVKSSFFSIEVAGFMNRSTQAANVVVERKGENLNIMYWRVE
ncbi:MAG: type II secretion system minor pseudopilin GspK [Thermodesulfobacteriota bacterium]|nr:type II secretion system minor pseudopilin GspK [Thermodesulfobacteriota bacterium]